jgi:hypothetical protein
LATAARAFTSPPISEGAIVFSSTKMTPAWERPASAQDLSRGGDGAAVISDKGELKGDCSSQASFVVLAKEAAVLPLHEGVNRDSRGGATKTASDPRGDVLVEQELEHFSASRL